MHRSSTEFGRYISCSLWSTHTMKNSHHCNNFWFQNYLTNVFLTACVMFFYLNFTKLIVYKTQLNDRKNHLDDSSSQRFSYSTTSNEHSHSATEERRNTVLLNISAITLEIMSISSMIMWSIGTCFSRISCQCACVMYIFPFNRSYKNNFLCFKIVVGHLLLMMISSKI